MDRLTGDTTRKGALQTAASRCAPVPFSKERPVEICAYGSHCAGVCCILQCCVYYGRFPRTALLRVRAMMLAMTYSVSEQFESPSSGTECARHN